MPETFCAIDFETACGSRASVCALGLVRLDAAGTVLASDGGLIVPPTGMDSFAPGHMRIHRIGPCKVRAANAPGWDRVLPWLAGFVGDDLLVAHNAAFERSVIAQASQRLGLQPPVLQVACTVKMARLVLPDLPDHKLPTVAAALGVPQANHHDALDDALVAGRVAAALLERSRFTALPDLARAAGEQLAPTRLF